MSYINKEELIKKLEEEKQNIWHRSRVAGAYVSYDSTKARADEVYVIMEIVNNMPITEEKENIN